MALKRDVRYPGRWTAASSAHPQGAFKNRSAPGSLDGSYIEQDWANDWDGFMSSLLSSAGIVANGAVDAVGASQYFDALTVLLNRSAGTTGSSRNLKMSVPAASASASITADEIIVSTSLGAGTYRLSGFNKTINLATTGAGGMDTGTAPVSGFVAIYAIYNPTTGVSALLAKDATSAVQPTIYGGANMPAGYTASALVSVWTTDASGLLKTGYQIDRFVWTAGFGVLSTTTANGTLTALNISAAVPMNAVSAKVRTSIAAANSGTTMITSVAGSTSRVGISTSAGTSPSSAAGLTTEAGIIPIITPQTIFYTDAVGAGLISGYSITIAGYGF